MKKLLVLIIVLAMVLTFGGWSGCGESTTSGSAQDTQKTKEVANILQTNQPTPTDIDYSLERYNLIRREYWVNGQRERANTLPCSIEKPLGYIALFSSSGAIINTFIVDGKVSSLQNYLTPVSEYYEEDFDVAFSGHGNEWLSDTDGTYGNNPAGIFFFTPDGKYIEWTGTYLYSDIPFTVDDPVLKMEVVE